MDSFEIVGPGFVVTGKDEQSMARSASGIRQQIAFYASTPAYRGVLDLHGWGDAQNELNRMVPPHTKPACSVVESVRCEQERAVHGDLGILRKKRRVAEKAGDVFQRPNVEVVDNGVEVVVVERILQGIHVGEHRRHQ